MSVPVAYPNNQITLILDVGMSNGSNGALPADTVLQSNNPAVLASWLNFGMRQAWVRLAGGAQQPQSATITASSASAGLSASFTVDFLAAPPVVPVSFTWNEAGAVISQG